MGPKLIQPIECIVVAHTSPNLQNGSLFKFTMQQSFMEKADVGMSRALAVHMMRVEINKFRRTQVLADQK